MKEHFLHKKLQERKDAQAFRQLQPASGLIDFCSNDYLGIVKNGLLEQTAGAGNGRYCHGSTGSRLLSGNSALAEATEALIANFHDAEAALIFNSGYDANTGLLSCVPQRGDTIVYDQLCHASIRDGVRLSFAQAFSFRHNDLQDLQDKLRTATGQVFVVTESIFSMDGDEAPLKDMVAMCERHDACLIVDEAHATGISGNKGEGLVQAMALHKNCFARVHTFGKAMGAHGAAVVGSSLLRDYLVNFSRQFIYTTALPELSIAGIKQAYTIIPSLHEERRQLWKLAQDFQSIAAGMGCSVMKTATPIQGIIIPGNEAVKQTAARLQENGFDARPILYPTVPKGSERIRIVLHSFNTVDEVSALLQVVSRNHKSVNL
ncbi:MAG TPA: 8-amino-7-oxononanoate synthase [Chitinophagaceae bacterium]|nr:8-amino-7-oxononanoate synthase [Chitinophagaceae bacterium]